MSVILYPINCLFCTPFYVICENGSNILLTVRALHFEHVIFSEWTCKFEIKSQNPGSTWALLILLVSLQRCWSRTHSGGPTSDTMASCGTWTTTEQIWSRHWVVWRAYWSTHCSREPTSQLGRVCSGRYISLFEIILVSSTFSCILILFLTS